VCGRDDELRALRDAFDRAASGHDRARAEGLLLGCLALAGHVDEALRLGERLIAAAGRRGGPTPADVHMELAGAAIEATRWAVASAHLEAAKRLNAADPRPGRGSYITVLAAELALAGDDIGQAGQLAAAVLDTDGASPRVRCQALEITGRSARLRDLGAARRAFEDALRIAGPRTCRSGDCTRCTSSARSTCSTTGGPSC
jgi:hypothetical protein